MLFNRACSLIALLRRTTRLFYLILRWLSFRKNRAPICPKKWPAKTPAQTGSGLTDSFSFPPNFTFSLSVAVAVFYTSRRTEPNAKACCYVPGRRKVWLHRFYQANHSIILPTIPITAQPKYVSTVPIIITISTKKFFKCSIIISFKLFSFGRPKVWLHRFY